MTNPQRAKSVQVRACKHGTVCVDLFDADDQVFATATLDADSARQIAAELSEICTEIQNGSMEQMECKGHV